MHLENILARGSGERCDFHCCLLTPVRCDFHCWLVYPFGVIFIAGFLSCPGQSDKLLNRGRERVCCRCWVVGHS